MRQRDGGLQAERTTLAWRRTTLAAAALSALLVRVAAQRGWGAATIPAVIGSVTALAAFWGERTRRSSDGAADRAGASAGLVAFTAWAAAATAVSTLLYL